MFRVQLFEPLARDVGINLRRRDIRMAEQQLHYAQIGAMVDEMGSEGVAQGVGRDGFADTCDDGAAFNQIPECLSRHGAAARRDKQCIARLAGEQGGAGFFKVSGEPIDSYFADRHQALFRTFTPVF